MTEAVIKGRIPQAASIARASSFERACPHPEGFSTPQERLIDVLIDTGMLRLAESENGWRCGLDPNKLAKPINRLKVERLFNRGVVGEIYMVETGQSLDFNSRRSLDGFRTFLEEVDFVLADDPIVETEDPQMILTKSKIIFLGLRKEVPSMVIAESPDETVRVDVIAPLDRVSEYLLRKRKITIEQAKDLKKQYDAA